MRGAARRCNSDWPCPAGPELHLTRRRSPLSPSSRLGGRFGGVMRAVRGAYDRGSGLSRMMPAERVSPQCVSSADESGCSWVVFSLESLSRPCSSSSRLPPSSLSPACRVAAADLRRGTLPAITPTCWRRCRRSRVISRRRGTRETGSVYKSSTTRNPGWSWKLGRQGDRSRAPAAGTGIARRGGHASAANRRSGTHRSSETAAPGRRCGRSP